MILGCFVRSLFAFFCFVGIACESTLDKRVAVLFFVEGITRTLWPVLLKIGLNLAQAGELGA